MKNLVFDLGNVLVRYDHLAYVKGWVSSEKTAEAVDRAIFAHPIRIETDRGTMTDEQAADIMAADAPQYSDVIHRIMANWTDMICEMPDGRQLLEDAVAAGIPCYYLSNYPVEAFEKTAAKMPWLRHFKNGLISAHVKMVKPEPAIYQAFLERCGLQAEDCIFMDDMPENVAAAREAGMHALVYTSAEDARRQLAEKYSMQL